LSEQIKNVIEKNHRYRGKIDNPNTHIHHDSLSWIAAGTSMESGDIKLVYFPKS